MTGVITGVAKIELASISSRLIALLTDSLVLGIFTGVVYLALGNTLNETEIIAVFFFTIAYQWYFLTNHNGQTPGKMLMGIRVIKSNGHPLTGSDAVVRTLGYILNWLLLGIGWLPAFWDDNQQGLHDSLASTYVVRANR
jgi:uncharacterized RDD family membrane protein YckC